MKQYNLETASKHSLMLTGSLSTFALLRAIRADNQEAIYFSSFLLLLSLILAASRYLYEDKK